MSRTILTAEEMDQKFVKVFFGDKHAIALDTQSPTNKHVTMRFFIYDDGYYLEGWNNVFSSRWVAGMKTNLVKAINYMQKYCNEDKLANGEPCGYKYKPVESLDSVSA